jgi:hypothetical protein
VLTGQLAKAQILVTEEREKYERLALASQQVFSD